MRAAFPIHLLAIYTNYLFTNYFILETQNVSQSTDNQNYPENKFVGLLLSVLRANPISFFESKQIGCVAFAFHTLSYRKIELNVLRTF